jgi:hypothetical protein
LSSKILVDELAGKTAAGNITITSEGGAVTQSLQQGLVKAWNTTSSDGTTIYDSFNISSLGDFNTGRQDHNVSNNFVSSNIVPTFTIGANYKEQWTSALATSMWRTNNYTGSAYQDERMRTVCSGDLA